MSPGSDLGSSIMRTVSFVERIELEFSGNILTQAMVLADVDNDTANELIVGNIEGKVGIFKGDSPQPWRTADVGGMLTCLAVGEIHLGKKKHLVCMTAEGWCYVYDITSTPCHVTTASNLSVGEEDCDCRNLSPTFTQELPANARVMCLADINCDGTDEMVIGYSDRVVRAFRWQSTSDSELGHFVLSQRWQLAGQIGSITINYNTDKRPQLMVSQPGATFVTLQVKTNVKYTHSESRIDQLWAGTERAADRLPDRSESLADLVAAKARLNRSNPNKTNRNIITSRSDTNCLPQDGQASRSVENVSTRSLDMSGGQSESRGAFTHLKSESGTKLDESDTSLEKSTSPAQKPDGKSSLDKLDTGSDSKGGSLSDVTEDLLVGRMLDASLESRPTIVYHPLAHHQTRNKDTSTVIIGGINRGRSTTNTSSSATDSDTPFPQTTYYALATLDGSLILVENDSIIWSLQVDHYLFALSKLDVTGNGKEEVVCCSWSGQTYIINHSKDIVRYQFPDSVAAFCAGYYSTKDQLNTPCFVYATFNNRIYIYPNISLPRVESTNLLEVMARQPDTQDILRKFNISSDDTRSQRDLYHWCLYGTHA